MSIKSGLKISQDENKREENGIYKQRLMYMKENKSLHFGLSLLNICTISFLVIFIISTFVSCENALLDTDSFSTINGIVVDDSTGVGISGASVTTNPATEAIITNTDGEFNLEDVLVGEYSISVKKKGYERTSVSVSAREDRVTQATIVLRPDTGREENKAMANVEITNWWNTTSQDSVSVYVNVEYRITNIGETDIAEYDVSFRIINSQGEFFHDEQGSDLQVNRSKTGDFEKHIREDEATEIEVYDYWLRNEDL